MVAFLQFVLSLISVGAIVYAMGWIWRKVFLNVTQEINDLVIDPKRPEHVGVSHGQRFGAHLAFDQFDIDLSQSNRKQLTLTLKHHVQAAIMDVIVFGKKLKRLGVFRYQLQGHDPLTIRLPNETVEVIPVMHRINDQAYAWNVYTIEATRLWAFSLVQAVSLIFLMRQTINVFYYFYQASPSSCPLCQLNYYPILQSATWWIGLIAWVIIHLVTMKVFATYRYGKGTV